MAKRTVSRRWFLKVPSVGTIASALGISGCEKEGHRERKKVDRSKRVHVKRTTPKTLVKESFIHNGLERELTILKKAGITKYSSKDLENAKRFFSRIVSNAVREIKGKGLANPKNREEARRLFEKIPKHVDGGFPLPKEVYLLLEAFSTRKKDCYIASYLYVEIGRELGIPIKFVDSGEHLYVALETEEGLQGFEATQGYPREIGKTDRILTKEQERARIPIGIGCFLVDSNKFKQAEVELRNALKLDAQNAITHAALGGALYGLKRYAEAIAEYEKALEIHPQYAKAHNSLGVIFYDLKRYEEAEAAHKKAIELEPDFALAHRNLGIVYHKLGNVYHRFGKLEEASEAYEKAEKLSQGKLKNPFKTK